MWLWMCGIALGAGPWMSTFGVEVDRDVSPEIPRVVLAVGSEAVLPGTALCSTLRLQDRPCEVQVLSDRDARRPDAQLASRGDGLVYVVRPAVGGDGVTVAVFEGIDNRIDWYTATPTAPVHNGVTLQGIEARLAEVEAAVAALASATPASPSPSEEDEGIASGLLRQATEATNDLQIDDARAILQTLETTYAGTRATHSAARLRSQLSIVGKPEIPLNVTSWLQGDGKVDLGGSTLYVFWEIWCPHCRREVPQLQDKWMARRDAGLQLVTLTKMTRGVESAEVEAFLEEHALTFPVGIDPGALSSHYGISGIPAAALVRDGEVVWRGHPAHLDDDLLDRFLAP